jgi:hypothetical protein
MNCCGLLEMVLRSIRYDVDSGVIFPHDPVPCRQVRPAGMQHARAAESFATAGRDAGHRALNHFQYTEMNKVV